MRDANEVNYSQKCLSNPLPGICSFGLIYLHKSCDFLSKMGEEQILQEESSKA